MTLLMAYFSQEVLIMELVLRQMKNLGNNTGFNGFPQIAVSGSNVYVVWTNNAQTKHGQVFFTRSTDNGSTFESPVIST